MYIQTIKGKNVQKSPKEGRKYGVKKWCEGSGEKKQWNLWAAKMRVVTEIIRKNLNSMKEFLMYVIPSTD